MQDNVFVNVIASIQYRVLAENASDAFYKLSDTRSQIQAYVFDGNYDNQLKNCNFWVQKILEVCISHTFSFSVTVIRASVPRLHLDDVFEQKNDIAKEVADELEKVS